jgi:hypothetical protein
MVTSAGICILTVAAEQLPQAAAGSSPDVTGQKYGDASSALSDAGLEPVVSTTVGDRKAWSDCMVTFTQKRDVKPPPNSKGGVRHQVLVSLNCDAATASAKTPGYSALSPQARAAAKAAPSA